MDYIEIIPRLYISYFKSNIIKNKKFDTIIYLSKNEPFLEKIQTEQIRIPVEYNDSFSLEEKNNEIYQYLFDVTDFIHEKINNNKYILLLGNENNQDLETFITAYYIRYGKINIEDSIRYLKSKMENIFYPKCLFYFALKKFNYEINKLY